MNPLRLHNMTANAMTAKLFSIALLFLGLLGSGCSSGAAEGADHALAAADRSGDPRLLEARAALEAGRPASAEGLLANIGVSAGVEGPLCLARVRLATGKVVAALAAVEEARRLAPEDPRVYATAAEILALAGRSDDAEDELARGAEFGPDSPDLERARAFIDLTRPGQGPVALARLEAALAADPDLPYCDWPMAQAFLLTGRALLGEGQAELAADHAREALGLVPDLATAEELLGTSLASCEDFVGAISALGRAGDMGLDVDLELAEVHTRAAMTARLLGRKDLAEDHYIEARALGLGDEELGSGVDFLVQQARLAYGEGQSAGLRDDFVGAAEHFARSLELAPGGPLALDAMDGLAGARFRLKDYSGAVLVWTEVQAAERATGAGADSLTQLNIARARVLSGQMDAARAVLREYLERYPSGSSVDATRALLAQVPE